MSLKGNSAFSQITVYLDFKGITYSKGFPEVEAIGQQEIGGCYICLTQTCLLEAIDYLSGGLCP